MSPLDAAIKEALREVLREELPKLLQMQASSDVLSTEDAAKIAKRHPETIREWVRSGALPSSRRGRSITIRRDDLDRFLSGEPAGLDPLVASLTTRSR